jgi:ComF family protein
MVITAYHYNKGNAVQQLIHRFKYRGMKDIGVFLGEQLGKEIIRSGHADDIDLILPVPLHPKKKKKRGFNQSEIIAVGMASVTGKELNAKCLYRRTYSDTQTRKTKYERWENVEKIFSLRDPEMLSGKHLLLVDDVITTGATLEACAQVLMKTEGIRISVAAVAFTRG